MNNNDIIAKLTLGTDETKTIKVTNGEEDIEVTIRPLTTGELTTLKALENKPYKMELKLNENGEMESVEKLGTDNLIQMGMSDFTEYQYKSMYTAIAWSMDIPVKAVENFKPGVPEQIFREIVTLNNLTNDNLNLIKRFR